MNLKTSLLGGLLIAIAAASSAYLLPGLLPKKEPVHDTKAFWNALHVQGNEVEQFGSLKEMASASDVVVRGTFSKFEQGRQIEYSEEDVVTYGKATLVVAEELRGKAPSRSFPVEFILPYPPKDVPEVIDTLSNSLPQEELVVFLRAKRGRNEQGQYRLVNSAGLWTSSPTGLTAPLSEEFEEAHAQDTRPLAAKGTPESIAEDLAAIPEHLRNRPKRTPADLGRDQKPSFVSPVQSPSFRQAVGTELAGKLTVRQLADYIRQR